VSCGTQGIPRSRSHFAYGAITFCGLTFQTILLWFRLITPCWDPTTPRYNYHGLGCSHFARRYFGNHYCFIFLWLLRWFSSPRSLCLSYGFRQELYGITRIGLPHSEISGSTVVCTYPELIAAYHVLHRLFVPRHPPYALSNLTENLLPHRQILSKITKDHLLHHPLFNCQRTMSS
jgi:hypothetical protein